VDYVRPEDAEVRMPMPIREGGIHRNKTDKSDPLYPVCRRCTGFPLLAWKPEEEYTVASTALCCCVIARSFVTMRVRAVAPSPEVDATHFYRFLSERFGADSIRLSFPLLEKAALAAASQ